ncbi:MAG: FhaA domain-containing protein [Anaerotardibacter sp.]
MGFFSKFEHRVEDGFDGMNDKLFDAPISPVQIAKKAEKQMRRNKLVGAGKELAPTLYTVLVNPEDDDRLFAYYPTLAGETETYLRAKASETGLTMDGAPLVRFIVDDELRSGKFEVIAEMVSPPIIAQLREEEMQRYGLAPQQDNFGQSFGQPHGAQGGQPQYGAPQGGQPQGGFNHYQEPAPFDQASGVDVMAENQDYYNSAIADASSNTVIIDPASRQTSAPSLVNLSTGRTFDLVSARILIGRAINCDIVLDDLNASRTHAELRHEPTGSWAVVDLGSTNGTLVNGKHIIQATLNNNDRITIGTTTFLFIYQ